MSWKNTIRPESEAGENKESSWRDTVKKEEEGSNPFLEGALWALDKIDSVTGAPTRAAIDAGIDGENPISAFKEQFAEDTSKAPTGKKIMQKVGVPETSLSEVLPEIYNETGEGPALKKGGWADPTASGAAGLAVDVLADPTNLLGTGALKASGKIAGKAAKSTAKVAAGASKAVAEGAVMKTAKAADLLTNSTAVTETLQGLRQFVTPKIADDFDRFVNIAKKNGIAAEDLPSSVEFGPDSFITRAERVIQEGPVGQSKLEKFRDVGDQVQRALETQVTKVGRGVRLDEASAGQHLRDAFDRGVDSFFKTIDWTHNMVQKQAPGIALTPKGHQVLNAKLNGVEKFAKGRSTRGVTQTQKEQANQLLAAVNAVREASNYKQLYEAQKMIGDVAFKVSNSLADIPPDIEKLRDIYFSIDEALIDTTRKNLGTEIADKLVANNKAMSEFFGQKSVLVPIVGSKTTASENVFRSLVVNGDTRQIAALKKVLDPEDLQALKGAFLDSLVRRSADGSVQLGNLRNKFQGKKNQISALFEPSEIDSINELVELGERMGPAFMSSSGTGASNAFRDIYAAVLNAAGMGTIVDNLKAVARGSTPAAIASRPKLADKFTRSLSDLGEMKYTPLDDGALMNSLRAGAAVSRGAQVSQQDQQGQGPLRVRRPQNNQEPRFEGYAESETIMINPNEAAMFEQQLKKLDISNIEKSKRLNLIRKHGRAYVGQ